MRTPDGRSRNSYLPVELDDAECVASCTLDHADIDSEAVGGSMSTTHMNASTAALEVTFDGRQSHRCAIHYAAFLLEALTWYKANAFSIVEDLCISEFDFLCPQSAVNMHPIVPRSSLERLSWGHRASCSFLVLAPLSQHLCHLVPVQLLFFAIAIGLLLV